MKKTFVDIRNARTKEQIDTMKKIIAAGIDPFAKEHMGTHAKLKIFRESKHWIFAHNKWPYKGTKKHIVAISKKYHEDPWSLSLEETADLFSTFGKIAKEQKIKGGAIAMRLGDTLHSGATVKHLHAHLIEPNVENENYEPVPFYIGGQKTKKS